MLALQLCFLLSAFMFIELKCSDSEAISKYDFLLSQILEPYKYGLNNFEEHIDQAILNPLQHLLGDLLEDNPKPFKLGKLYQSFNSTEKEKDSKSIEPNINNNRMLSGGYPDCYNGGVSVDASVTTYTCNGQNVKKSDYEKKLNTEQCTVSTRVTKLCYCPYDYYGYQCENINKIVCKFERTSHPQSKCPEKTKDYVYSYGQNDQPCYWVKRDSELNLAFQAKCENERSQWNYEGIKMGGEEMGEIETRTLGVTFTYWIDQENIKISRQTETALKLRFANWIRLYKPLGFEARLTRDQIAGLEHVKFHFILDSKFSEYRIAGRYFYELEMDAPFAMGERTAGVLEDLGFVEPRNPNRNFRYWYFMYALLGLGVVGLTFFLVKYKKILSSGTKAEKYTQLIELSEMDHSDASAHRDATPHSG